MSQKLKLLLGIAALVVLLVGAYFLYDRLSADVSHDVLVSQDAEETPTEAETETETQTAPSDTEETTEKEEEEATANLVPDFTVTDADGNEVKLSDYFGKPIVLNFWASWCSPCKSEMPEFNAAWEELEGEVQFLMVNMTDGARETVESAREYVEGEGFTFPVLFDTKSEAAIAYSAYSLPTTYFIDAEGYVTARAVGAIDGETLQKGLDLIHPQA